MLPVHVSSSPIALAQVFRLAPFPLRFDWHARPLAKPLLLFLAVDPSAFHFGARIDLPPHYDHTLAPGSFASGLWEQDVIELFLHDDRCTAYQEFNLSPSGAFWTASFSDYRTPAQCVIARKPAAVFAQPEKSCWTAGFSFPRSSLGIQISFTERSTGAAFAIVGVPTRTYCTLQPGSGKPDFHRQNGFMNLQMLRI